MKLELTNHNILKAAFESITNIVDEITMTADDEGLHLRSLDKSHITFITMDLKKELFDTYECEDKETFAIDCTEFTKMLKKGKPSDRLELELTSEELYIIFKGDATRTFKILFVDMEYDSPVPPTIEHPCSVRIPSDLLKTYINDMEDFNESLTFIVDEDYLRIKSEGQMGAAEIEYLHGENITSVVRSNFSIPKLQDMLKASKFSKECILDIGEDMPLKLRMELVTGDGFIEYLLAPRLEQED